MEHWKDIFAFTHRAVGDFTARADYLKALVSDTNLSLRAMTELHTIAMEVNLLKPIRFIQRLVRFFLSFGVFNAPNDLVYRNGKRRKAIELIFTLSFFL